MAHPLSGNKQNLLPNICRFTLRELKIGNGKWKTTQFLCVEIDDDPIIYANGRQIEILINLRQMDDILNVEGKTKDTTYILGNGR